MGTITTKEHCIVDDGIAYTGSREDIVREKYTWRFDENGTLCAKQKYHYEIKLHSYGESFSEEERERDVIDVLFNRLTTQYKHYRSIH